MNAPEIANYINKYIIGPQKDSDKELTESAILGLLQRNCPKCGGMCKCNYFFPEDADVRNNNTKRKTTRKKASGRNKS